MFLPSFESTIFVANLDLHRLEYLFDLIRELVSREIKIQYKRSYLGVAWTIALPLTQLIVFSVVFKGVLKLDIPNYGAFVFCGLLVWNWFQLSTVQGAVAIIHKPELISRPGFPTWVLPIVFVTINLIHFLVSLPFLIVLLLMKGGILTWWVLLLPAVVAIQFVFLLGLSLIVATTNVVLRDTQHLLSVMLPLLFYLTPVCYDVKLVPPSLKWVYQLNPLTHLLEAYRSILIFGKPPELTGLLLLSLLSVIVVWYGNRIFHQKSHTFIEEL